MGKVKLLRPGVAMIKPRIGFVPGDEKAADVSRNANSPWRAWYKTKRWQDLRMEVFVRDAFTCQRSGIVCLGRHPEPNSPVANHKVPHKGDPALFWDAGNIETVSKAVHDGMIQSEERRAAF